MRSRSLIVALLVTAAPAAAQEPAPAAPAPATTPAGRPIRLGEALDVLVRQSGALARAEVDVAIADAARTEASGLDDWRLSATGAWVSNRRGFIAGTPFQLTADDSLSVDAGLERSLPSGGTVSVRAGGSYAKNTYAVLDGMGDRFDIDSEAYQSQVLLSLSHPLLGGAGRRVARVARRRAEAQRTVAELARAAIAAETVLDAVRAYWELAYAERALAIQRSSLALAREQLRITRSAIEGKAAAPTEALAVEQAIAVREQAILLAEIDITERSLTLRRTVGLDIGPGDIELQAADALTLSQRTLELDALLAAARAGNPRLALARQNAEVAAIELTVAADLIRPRLDLSGRVGPVGAAGNASDALEQMGTLDGYTAGATLTYGQTLGNRSARGAHRRVQETVRKAKVDVAELERETAVAVVRAVNLVRSAKKRVEVSEVAIKLAEQNLASEKVLFQAGDTRAFDVLERQEELSAARLSRERAMVDYQVALANLDTVTGALLRRLGIAILPAKR